MVDSMAKTCARATGQYQDAFDAAFYEMSPLSHAAFWTLMGKLRDLICQSNVHDAVDEFYRLSASSEYSLEDALRFANQYLSMTVKLHKVFEKKTDWEFDKSGDGMSDFTDALPLVGEKIVGRILQNEYASPNEIYRSIQRCSDKVRWGSGKTLGQLVMDGELYVTMNLHHIGRARYIYEVAGKQIDRYGTHFEW